MIWERCYLGLFSLFVEGKHIQASALHLLFEVETPIPSLALVLGLCYFFSCGFKKKSLHQNDPVLLLLVFANLIPPPLPRRK